MELYLELVTKARHWTKLEIQANGGRLSKCK